MILTTPTELDLLNSKNLIKKINCEFFVINEIDFFFEEEENRVIKNFFNFVKNFELEKKIFFGNSSKFYKKKKLEKNFKKFFGGEINLIEDKELVYNFVSEKIRVDFLSFFEKISILEKIIEKSEIPQILIFGLNLENSKKMENYLKKKNLKIQNLLEEKNSQSKNYKLISDFQNKIENILICDDFDLKGINFDFKVQIINFSIFCDFESLFSRFEIGRGFSGEEYKVFSFVEKDDLKLLKDVEDILLCK